jgi:glycosyltransferase involved in cell wall biosynthesis
VRALEAEAARTPGVTLLGRVSHGELVAVYRSGSVFVSMSEHEGFGVPLLEAMAFGLPVIAFDAAAIRETLRGAGVLLVEKRPEVVAELIDLVLRDAALRAAILETQARSLAELDAIDYATLLLDRLGPILGEGAA